MVRLGGNPCTIPISTISLLRVAYFAIININLYLYIFETLPNGTCCLIISHSHQRTHTQSPRKARKSAKIASDNRRPKTACKPLLNRTRTRSNQNCGAAECPTGGGPTQHVADLAAERAKTNSFQENESRRE